MHIWNSYVSPLGHHKKILEAVLTILVKFCGGKQVLKKVNTSEKLVTLKFGQLNIAL
jgi:hypothetical protein